MSPIRTPGKRQSLRRSVLLSSAKKPIFTVTDMIVSQNSGECAADSKEAVALTPRRKSNKFQFVEQGCASVSGMLLVYFFLRLLFTFTDFCLFSFIDNEFPVQNVTPNQKKIGYFLHYFFLITTTYLTP